MIRLDHISKSSIVLGCVTIGTKGIGYLEKIILAYYFGTTLKVDVYNVILLAITNIFIFFREIVEPGYLNLFLKKKNANDDEGAWKLFNTYFSYILLASGLITIGAMMFPESIIKLYSPGLSEENKEITRIFVLIAMPSCIFLSLSTLTGITLNALKQFWIPASGELALKILVIIALLGLYTTMGIYAAAIGLLIGSAIKLIVHLGFLWRYWLIKRVDFSIKYIKSTWSMTWPLIIGVIFSQIHTIVDTAFASYSSEGSLSALSYAKKIIDFPILIFPYALSIVIFPYMSEYVISNNKEKMETLFAKILHILCIVFVPLAIIFFVNASEIVNIAFKRGSFTQSSVDITSLPLQFYSIGLVFFALEAIIVIFFFAHANTKTPIIIGMLCSIEAILLTIAFTRHFGFAGVALSLVVSKMTKTVILLVVARRYISFRLKNRINNLCKIIIPAIAMALTIKWLQEINLDNEVHSTYASIYLQLWPSIVGLAIYVVSSLILHIKAIRNENGFRLVYRR